MVAIRNGICTEQRRDVQVFLPPSALNESDAKEFVANDRFEQSVAAKPPGRLLFDDIVTKADFIRTFAHVKPMLDVRPGHVVLELGASHGWASVLLKDDCPAAHVVVSDMVPECLHHCAGYERLIGRTVDGKWAFSCRDMPFADAQFDRIFTFAAFHHFGDRGDYTRTLAEIGRVLKPGGRLVLLYEPATPALLYRLAFRRVNRKRAGEGVDEDVLVAARLEPIARRLGLTLRSAPFAFYQFRSSAVVTVYYYLLSKLRLGRFATCTANLVLDKAAAAPLAADADVLRYSAAVARRE